MRLKRLTIHGFKSYRDQTVVDPFHAGVNVVVGRNGSGKSNFFAAIRFVLSDSYTQLSRTDRQALLHEGTSANTTLSAYVEIVFDNADGRFPTGKDEVVLRRTIGAKKDEYSLDRKTTPKGEVMSLLESAGFSRSNPYYIVPQGRITHITNQKDGERLDLLKEVAGTRVYEERRSESLKIIKETETKREKIDELLTVIDERLQELEAEKGELKEYQTLDRQRRVLEYQIHSRELDEMTEMLATLEAERADEAVADDDRRREYSNREKRLAQLERQLQAGRRAKSTLEQERTDAMADRRDAVKSRTQVELLVADLEEAGRTSTVSRQSLERELASVEASIAAKETELGTLTTTLETAQATEQAARIAVAETSAKSDALYAKQGRDQQFVTQADRDAHIDGELTTLRSTVDTRERRQRDLTAEVASARTSLTALTDRSRDLRAQLATRVSAMDELKKELEALKTEQATLSEQRKELWKEDAKLEQTVAHEQNALRDAERQLLTMMDKATSNGLRAVKRIAAELGLDGCYGPLYELFTVSEAYRTAVEVTAGNSLFHVVCDTDETATKLLDALTRQHAGRVTFMPLNRLRVSPVTYPPRSDDVFPLLDKLKLKNRERDGKAFEQIFGKTLVCKELQMGPAYVKSHGLSVITADGDRIDRKGAWTGGYHDVRRSRLESIERTKTLTERYETGSRRHAEVKRQLAVLDQSVTRIVGKIQIAEGKLRASRDGRAPIVDETLAAQKDEEQLRTRIETLEGNLAAATTAIASMRAQIVALEAERGTTMEGGLSAAEATSLKAMATQLETQKRDLVTATKKRSDLARRKGLLEVELAENLRRRREQLRTQLEGDGDLGDGLTSTDAGLQARQAELAALATSIDAIATRLGEIDSEIEAQTTEIAKFEADLEKTQAAQHDDSRSLARQQKSVERYRAKRQLLQSRKDDCNASIRELGVLPEEAFAKTTTRSEKLVKQLHKVHESLKQYAHVNKRAIEQYNNFTKQRAELVTRQDELDNSHTAIEDLIEQLDQRKDEAIERTFKQVSTYFTEIFAKLVPTGRGRLIMQKRLDDESQEPSAASGKPARSAIDRYTGIAIKVSFNSKSDEGLRIQQLSGGQKSLVALAMVFAIQKCDPAPFYLFDEIDANLDADRRTAVASMISELSEDAQFVITTFRPELLAKADAHFGVIFDARKVSSIRPIKAADARTFIEAAERPAAAAPAPIASSRAQTPLREATPA